VDLSADVRAYLMAIRPMPPIGEEHRDLDCDHYGDCIAIAAREGWTGLHCGECPMAGETTEIERDTAQRPTAYGPRTPRRRKIIADLEREDDPDALAVLGALIKAEHKAGGPVAPRYVGAYLGTGGAAAKLLLTDLEGRGYVRRVGQEANHIRWTAK